MLNSVETNSTKHNLGVEIKPYGTTEWGKTNKVKEHIWRYSSPHLTPKTLSNLTHILVDKKTCYWSMKAWFESLVWPYKTGHGCVPVTPATGRDTMWRLADPRRSLPGSLFQTSELVVQWEALTQSSKEEGNRGKHQTAFSAIYLNQTLRNNW